MAEFLLKFVLTLFIWMISKKDYGVKGLEINSYSAAFGTYMGKFKTLYHDVTGDVYAVDNITFYVKGFTYDGEAPDAYFFAGNKGKTPSNRGFIIPNEKGKEEVLGPYRNQNLKLTFPITKKGQRGFFDIKWISIWCRQFAIDFGHVVKPDNFSWPEPYVTDGFKCEGENICHVEGVEIRNSRTLILTNFSFNAIPQDTIFVMGNGDSSQSGFQIPDEKGSTEFLQKYLKKNIILKIPEQNGGGFIPQYFGLWSQTKGLLGSVTFPEDIRIPPVI